jgi:serine/threonine protein phosphatase PrpC
MTTIQFPSAVTPDAGGCPYNQDRAFVDPAGRRIGVFDGHGDLGDVAAQVAADTFAAGGTFADAETAIHVALRNTMEKRGATLMEEDGAIASPGPRLQALYRRGSYGGRGAIIRGGTTASILTIAEDGALTVVNVGDSDVVVFDGPADPGTSLTADHSCTNMAEWTRVHATHPTSRFKFNNPFASTERPVWLPKEDSWILNPAGGYHYSDVRNSWAAYFTAPDGSESLAMTRALGDFHMKRYGLSATPSVQTAPPPAHGTVRAVVIGSDGLWDSLQFEEAREIVYREGLVGNADAASSALLEYGKARARALMGPAYDNIVCAVVYIAVADGEAITAAAPEAAAEAAVPEPAVLDCELHGPPARNPGGLWYSMNESGSYSMTAPPCNGCAHGDRDAERAALSMAYLDAYYTHRDDPTPANKAIMDAAHCAKTGGAAAGGGGGSGSGSGSGS